MDLWLFLVSICLQKIQENLLCWISHHVLQIYDLNTWQMMQSGKATAIDFQPKKISRWTSFLWSLKTMTMVFCHCCLRHKPFSGHRGFVHNSILNTNDSFISFKANNEDTLSVILKYSCFFLKHIFLYLQCATFLIGMKITFIWHKLCA